MQKKTYHKPVIVGAEKVRQTQTIQLAGVRALPSMMLKSELLKSYKCIEV